MKAIVARNVEMSVRIGGEYVPLGSATKPLSPLKNLRLKAAGPLTSWVAYWHLWALTRPPM